MAPSPRHRLRWSSVPVSLPLLVALATSACGKEKLIEALCQDDGQCEQGYLCERGSCVPAASKRCEVVLEGQPLLQPFPHAVGFGDVSTEQSQRKLALHSIGNCTLTLYEASLAKGPSSPFGCDLCSGQFPIEIFPGRSREVTLSFTGSKVGVFTDDLKLLSDDHEFPELRVPVHATFLGVPDLHVTPSPVSFGYVAKGRAESKYVQVTNRGTGTATMTVESVSLEPADTQHFSLLEAPTLPQTLAPVSSSSSDILSFLVQYHPRTAAKHTAELVIVTASGTRRVTVTGDSETPPKLKFSPDAIQLGQVKMGQTHAVPLTLVNEGGAPLSVSYSWGGPKPTTDLFATPTVVPPIAAGAYLEMQVAFTATAVGPVTGLLVLATNDPARPSVTIPVYAEGLASPGPEAVKVEMFFENGSETVFDQDLRNVDLTLEHPYGYVCNRDYPKQAWGKFGNATWISFGVKEEPERLVLAEATVDETYRVHLQYREDCSSLPSGLAAGLLGISVEALVGYLTSGVAQIDGKDVAELIEDVCVSHSSSNVTVRAYVNGALVKEKTVNLAKRGDTTYVLELVRSGGKFSVQ